MSDFVDEIDADEQAFLDKISAECDDLSEADAELYKIDRLLGALKRREQKVASNNAITVCEQDRIRAWQEGENEKLDQSIGWLRFQIEQLSPKSGEAFKKAFGQKSRRLSNGTIGFNSSGGSLEIWDEEAALSYAIENNLETKETHSVSKVVLKEFVRASGVHMGPGWKFTEGVDKFYVKPS